MKRLLVFGLDGGTFSVLDRYARANPDGLFSRWLRQGYARTLMSTWPYFTAPGWVTFMTGLDPGVHGIYHWRRRYSPAAGGRSLVTTTHLDEATFWWYAQWHGAQVSVSNFPMQYPAPPTRGPYICGTLAPETAPEVTWPPDLIDQIRAAFPTYRFEIDKGLSYVDRPGELRSHVMEVGRMHAAVAEAFGRPEDADLLMHVVTVTDRMQHFFWHCHDPGHPRNVTCLEAVDGDPVFDAYQLAEALLESLWKRGAWDNAMVVSDHGAGPSTRSFRMDRWLADRGYTVLNDDGSPDVEASRAYSGEEPEGAVYVNRVGRDGCGLEDSEYQGFVERLRRELLEVMVPAEEARAFDRVLLQSELYTGPAAREGPDLVLLPASGVHPRPGGDGPVFDDTTRLVGGHRPEGIFIGFGADFPPSPVMPRKPRMHLSDMFPLMCALMGLPLPSGLPGRLPEDLAVRPSSEESSYHWPDQIRADARPEPTHDPEVLARLQDLGYIEWRGP